MPGPPTWERYCGFANCVYINDATDTPPVDWTYCWDPAEIFTGCYEEPPNADCTKKYCDLQESSYEWPEDPIGLWETCRNFEAYCCTSYCSAPQAVFCGECPNCPGFEVYNPETGLCEDTPCTGQICVTALDRCTGDPVSTVNISVDFVSCGFTDASGYLCCEVSCSLVHTLGANSAMFTAVAGTENFAILTNGQVVHRTIWMDRLGFPCDTVGCVVPEYWCAITETCVEVEEPPCSAELNCVWNFRSCTWTCDLPSCDPGEWWDQDTCECKPCEPLENECWCETTGTCVTCTAPPCHEELRCYWSSTACEWICADPADADDPTDPGYCPPGEEWDWLTCACITPPPDADGVDLAAQVPGHVYRSYKTARDGTDVAVDVTRDKGVNWIELGVVATDCAQDGAPSLCVTKWDELFLFYHNAARELRTWFSADDGATWEDRGTWSDLNTELPKACVTPDGSLLLVMWNQNGGALRVLRSEDYGATWVSQESFTAAKQRASIAMDRHGYVHLMFRDGFGRILHSFSTDGGEEWTTPAQMGTLTGDTPSYAIGPTNQALLAYHSIPLSFWAWLTEEDYSTPDDAIAGMTVFAVPQWLGVLVDEEDTPWVVGRLGGGGFGIDQGTADGGLTFEPPS